MKYVKITAKIQNVIHLSRALTIENIIILILKGFMFFSMVGPVNNANL